MNTEETKEALETPANEATQTEPVPSMDEFTEEINQSFHKIKEGDVVKGTVLGASDTEVTVDLGSYAEGLIPVGELSNDPSFSIKEDIKAGDSVTAIVLKEDNGEGNIVLSLKRAADMLAWDTFRTAMEQRRVYTAKVSQAVKGGVVTYIDGIRAFIPASQLSIAYVENLETYVGRTVEAVLITVDEEKKRLVLSAKEIEKERAESERNGKLSRLSVGTVLNGKIEKIAPYGVFVDIGDGLSGLVHISQICGKRIESPREVVKEGQEVKVKIIDVKEGKIRLSMKAASDDSMPQERSGRAPIEYSSKEQATTGLGDLLKNIKLS